ncbi:hypothetical protein C1X30_18385 [Pseudomonas sp. FW305-BF6]|nr:hypothetical protein C1X28_19875 [Pseudomonas sp. FW305-BF15]PNB79313.1 hypothetical protein C1X30_18385 [Pseudomonas sp. FW305-BF6]
MDILLIPQRRDDSLHAKCRGDTMVLNGQSFDFSGVGEGDTLPRGAIDSEWIVGDVERKSGQLRLTLLLPNPSNYSPEQAFPAPLLSVPDGDVVFPRPLPLEPDETGPAPAPLEWPQQQGSVDWSQLVTAQMKAAAQSAAHLAEMKSELAARNTRAATQIARIQDRVDTLGYGIDAGEATAADEVEQAALITSLKAWKGYKFSLGKVPGLPTWPTSPAWPAEPPIPVIEAAPMSRAPDEF